METPPLSHPPDFWTERYASGNTPWDLGQVAPPFLSTPPVLQQKIGPGAQVCVVGCGRGHEAAFFADAGFHVTGLDFSPLAIAEGQRLYGDKVQFVQADLFNLPVSLHHQFDAVIEHTCFCAITPAQREAYVKAVKTLLKPNGYLLALFYCHNEPDGPPYGSTPDMLEALLAHDFRWLSCETPTNSMPSRAGDERLVWCQRLHDTSTDPS